MPDYLFSHIHRIFTKIDETDAILLLLDYDGTLVSFRNRPQDVVTSDKVKIVLTSLLKNPKFTVVIVSGRTLHEIKQLLDIDGLSFVALHGLQIELANGKSYSKQIDSNIRSILEKIKEASEYKFKDEKGIYLEDKKLTLAFHYRLITEEKINDAIEKFLEIVKTVDTDKSLELIHGAKVVEVRPKGWNKGKVVELIYTSYASKKVLPIYIGDDSTDEDAFRAIGNRGITVFVSNNSNQSTAAQYWLKDPDDVLKFLKTLQLKLEGIKDTSLFE